MQSYERHICSRYSSDIGTRIKGDNMMKHFFSFHTDVGFEKATFATNHANLTQWRCIWKHGTCHLNPHSSTARRLALCCRSSHANAAGAPLPYFFAYSPHKGYRQFGAEVGARVIRKLQCARWLHTNASCRCKEGGFTSIHGDFWKKSCTGCRWGAGVGHMWETTVIAWCWNLEMHSEHSKSSSNRPTVAAVRDWLCRIC